MNISLYQLKENCFFPRLLCFWPPNMSRVFQSHQFSISCYVWHSSMGSWSSSNFNHDVGQLQNLEIQTDFNHLRPWSEHPATQCMTLHPWKLWDDKMCCFQSLSLWYILLRIQNKCKYIQHDSIYIKLKTRQNWTICVMLDGSYLGAIRRGYNWVGKWEGFWNLIILYFFIWAWVLSLWESIKLYMKDLYNFLNV